ncbi:MAG: hypothetical protein E7660_06035 [Ruminococcaceae bacterium]|nr:hypothetical protein [Oscillospiraceae bacterium]
MKKTIKILCLVMAFILFALMAMGSSSDDSGQKDVEVNDSANAGTSTESIEEQVLLERDGIKITANEYVDEMIMGEGIKLLIENTSAKNVGVGCNALIVNNYMISDLFSCSVAAGKKANETMYLSSSELEAAGIENIGQIEIYFHIYDSDSYDTLFDADVVTVKTNLFDKMDVTGDTSGAELYNANDIRIIGKYVDDTSFWGAAVLLYIENNSGRNISVSCENMSINGFMVNPLFYSNVYNNKMAFDEITIFSSDLEDNNIETIEDLELSFRIYDPDTLENIAETGPISFSVK